MGIDFVVDEIDVTLVGEIGFVHQVDVERGALLARIGTHGGRCGAEVLQQVAFAHFYRQILDRCLLQLLFATNTLKDRISVVANN